MCWWKTKREPLAIPGSCSTATRMLRCQSVEIITVGPHSTLDLRSHLATTQALLPFVRSRVASAVAGFDSEGWNRRNPIQNEVYPYKKQLMLLKKTLITVRFTTEINYNWMDWHNWWLVAVFRFHISWKDASFWWEKNWRWVVESPAIHMQYLNFLEFDWRLYSEVGTCCIFVETNKYISGTDLVLAMWASRCFPVIVSVRFTVTDGTEDGTWYRRHPSGPDSHSGLSKGLVKWESFSWLDDFGLVGGFKHGFYLP